MSDNELEAHKFAARFLVMSAGTIGSRLSAQDLSKLRADLAKEVGEGKIGRDVEAVWDVALADMATILKDDSLTSRVRRTADMASELLVTGVRSKLTSMVKPGKDGEFVPPLPFTAGRSQSGEKCK